MHPIREPPRLNHRQTLSLGFSRDMRRVLYQSPNQSSQKTAVDDPLLQVPPASRGNRVGAPIAVPLAKRGEPTEGGNCELWRRSWYKEDITRWFAIEDLLNDERQLEEFINLFLQNTG